MKSVIWTRSDDDWVEDKVFFKSSKPDVYSYPCIQTNILLFDLPALAPTHFVVTSPKTVRYLQSSKVLTELFLDPKKTVFCFGEKTEKAVQELRSVRRIENCESSEVLFKKLASQSASTDRYAILGAKTPIFDGKKFLEENTKSSAHYVQIYETVSPQSKPIKNIRFNDKTFLCFASPSACRHFFEINKIAIQSEAQVVCIGKTTAKFAEKYAKTVHVAEVESAESLALKVLDLATA